MLFIKATFFLMYLEIFKPFRWVRISVYVGLTLLCCFYGATTIVQFYFATPKHGLSWVDYFLSPEEYKANILSIPLSAVGLGWDVVLFVLPVAAVLQLQLPTSRKIGIALIFATGIL